MNNGGFSGDACYGPAGNECHAKDLFWNVDQYDRPAASYAAAANEGRFYDASIPTTRDWQELIQAGLENPSNAWLWGSDGKYWYNGGFGNALVRWSGVGAGSWAPISSSTFSLDRGSGHRNFRYVYSN
ncbi:hypothetical protein C2E25_15775 [Geothermobacter hydrogeniphilus]|uniref:Sulfatase-modifying factor enzyme 1 n=1 Tax=Geothermobacter hydrogeniphilus TaxID=1969733 RepID=A0A2K2H6C2_9BACT|nr:hypothetical protein [Geothermobacter hydrogeniphilus]PNU18790.1 hypothetical protein C2E25_15775 [Geothermobacter hydrogeniphilus]